MTDNITEVLRNLIDDAEEESVYYRREDAEIFIIHAPKPRRGTVAVSARWPATTRAFISSFLAENSDGVAVREPHALPCHEESAYRPGSGITCYFADRRTAISQRTHWTK